MEEIIIDGLDEIEMQNTAVDDIDSENVNLIFIGIDKSGSMSSYRGDMVSCLKEFKQALTDSKEADEILVARADFNSSINVGGYKKITEFDTNYDASGMTALYNVIEDGTQKLTDYMEYLKQQGVRVKAVFAIFSDGEDTVSNDPSEAKRRIQDLNSKEITTAFISFWWHSNRNCKEPGIQKYSGCIKFCIRAEKSVRLSEQICNRKLKERCSRWR